MNWTQEQRDELFRLWDHGKRSYSELAAHFGVTKNAIVGRMRREKEARGIPCDDKHSHRRPSNTDKPKKRKAMLTLPGRAEFVISKRVSPVIAKPDEGQLASIVDVTGCRWAVSFDEKAPGGHLFCNHATDEGQSYCPYHRQENVASYSRTLISNTVRAAWHAYKARAA